MRNHRDLHRRIIRLEERRKVQSGETPQFQEFQDWLAHDEYGQHFLAAQPADVQARLQRSAGFTTQEADRALQYPPLQALVDEHIEDWKRRRGFVNRSKRDLLSGL